MTKIDVSVVVLTYFHEKYLYRALESILSQKTTYNYEIIITDDHSTDGTPQIIKMYKEKYSDKIQCLFNQENIGIPANLYNGLCHCQGKYITLLSGDDYWSGCDSLQKKIDFMERNLDYYALCTQIEARLEGERPLWSSPDSKYMNQELTLKMYLNGIPFHTHGMVFRNELQSDEGKEYFSLLIKCSKYIDDSTMCLIVLNRGKVYAMDILAYAYRIEKNKTEAKSFNATNNIFTTSKKQIELYNNIHQFLPDIDLFKLYKKCLATAIPGAIFYHERRNLKEMIVSIPEEYRKRGLVIQSIPVAVKKCFLGVVKAFRK